MTEVAGPPTREMMLAHAEFVRGLARRLLRDESDAEDLAHDVLVTAMDAPPRHGGNPRGWLARVARNLALMRARAAARRRRREWAVAEARRGASTEGVAARLEVQRDVVTAVLGLDEPYRSTVFLRFYDGLKPAAIARRQGVPVGTVHTRIHRALAMLRARLDDSHGARGAWVGMLGGGLIVSAKAKAALVAAAVVLIAGGVGWMARHEEPVLPPTESGTTAPIVPAPAEPPVEVASAEEADDAAPPPGEWDLFVELVEPNGEPCSRSVNLKFLSEAGEKIATTDSNDVGRAHLAARGPGRLVVIPRSWGPAPCVVDGLRSPEGGRRDLRVQLEEGAVIEGLVLDANGKKLFGAQVEAKLIDPPSWIGEFKRRNRLPNRAVEYMDTVGQFRIAGLLPGRYRLELEVDHWAVRVAGVPPLPVPEADAGERGIVIQLAPSGLVTVTLADAESGGRLSEPADVFRVTDVGEEIIATRAGATFPVKLRVGKPWRVRARAKGYAPTEVRELLVETAGAEEAVEIRLRADPESIARLTLSIRDDLGRPVERVRVLRRIAKGQLFLGMGVRDTTGGRLVLDLEPGFHALCVRPPRGKSDLRRSDELQIELSPGEEAERQVVLQRGGNLRLLHPPGYRGGVLLETPEGVHVSGTGIKMLPEGGRILKGLPPGKLVVKSRRPDGRWVGQAVEVRAGATVDLVLDLPVHPAVRKGTDPEER